MSGSSARRAFLRGLAGAAGAAGGIGTLYWAWPTYNATSTNPHDPITTEQCSLLRSVPSGDSVDPSRNPGARTWSSFMAPSELQELLNELQPIKQKYGINLIEPVHAAIYRWQMSYLRHPPPVNMLRVTARPEHAQQRRPDWAYGEQCDEAKLPPNLAKVAQRIRQLPGLQLGPLRDVTVNWRHGGFLRLDPHVDPAGDGENVFILSVDSPAVLTLSPGSWLQLTRWLRMAWFADEREQVRYEAAHSWTDRDIDALLPPGSLLHLSGDARWRWTHGTRLGVEKLQEAAGAGAEAGGKLPEAGEGVAGGRGARGAGEGGLGVQQGQGGAERARARLWCWFGRPEELVERGLERHSVVFAFGNPDK